MNRREDGIVILNKEECTGCRACLSACLYEIIHFNENSNLAEKCNLCAHKIDKGLEPFCVNCCRGQAIHFGDLSDNNSKASNLFSDRNAFQLKIQAGTNPSIYYCRTKPKRRL